MWGLGIGNQIETSKFTSFVIVEPIGYVDARDDSQNDDKDPGDSNENKDDHDQDEGKGVHLKLSKAKDREGAFVSSTDEKIQARVRKLKEKLNGQKPYYTKKSENSTGSPVFDEKNNEVGQVTITASCESYKKKDESLVEKDTSERNDQLKRLDRIRNPDNMTAMRRRCCHPGDLGLMHASLMKLMRTTRFQPKG